MMPEADTLLTTRRRGRVWRGYLLSYAMIAPAVAFLPVFVVYPMLHIIELSLYKGNATNPYKEFVGLAKSRASSSSRSISSKRSRTRPCTRALSSSS